MPQAEPNTENPHTLPYRDVDLNTLEEWFAGFLQDTWDINFSAGFLVDTMLEIKEAVRGC